MSSQLRVNRRDYTLARRLRARQIPVDEVELERMRAASSGLEIREGGPSFAFNLPAGGAGYVFCADIWNESRRRLSTEHIVFKGLEGESGMHLISDPRKDHPMRLHKSARINYQCSGNLDYLTAREVYAFPGIHWHRYAREETLNHLIGPGCFLYPDDPPLEGFLLAVGQEHIPWDCADGEHLKVCITVFDQLGCSHAAWFHPTVERSREEKRLMEKIASLDPSRLREKQAARAARLGIQLDTGPEQEKTTNEISRSLPVLT